VSGLGLRRNRHNRPDHSKLAQRAPRNALDVLLIHTAPVTGDL
jgi:hypothetical protein